MNNLIVLKTEVGFPVTIEATAIASKNQAIANLKQIAKVENAADLPIAALALGDAAGILKRMEASRVEVKAPVLDAGKRIDLMASEFSKPIQAELDRVKRLVSDYHANEAARIAEENRKREEEEKKRRDEIERVQREAAQKAEAERVEAEAKARRAKSAESIILREREAEEARSRQATIAAEQEAARIAEQARIATIVPVEAQKIDGISSRKVWKYEVLDPVKVFKANPLLCKVEVIAYNVNDFIKKGMRECDGLRIYEDVETKIRAK